LKHKIENNDIDDDVTHLDNDNTIISYHELHNIVLDIVKSNQELQKQNMELQKQMIDVCKNMQPLVSNTINQNNSHNKTFNLQFFLNETCKDAMNISEFIENISLQLSDLENIGKMGYIEGISNIIIQNLRALDVEKRPVHCSDVKREIMYVKDEDKWEKENEGKQKIKQVISAVASKNRNLLPEYKKKYPQCMDPQSKKSDEYNHLIMESLGIGNGVAFNPAGTSIAVSHQNAPRISIYPWSAGFGTKYADPATLPTGVGNRVTFNPAGTVIAVAHNGFPFVSAYPWSAGTFGTKYLDPSVAIPGDGNGVAFNATGTAIAVSHAASPFVSAYPWSAGFGTKYLDPSTLPTGDGNGVAFFN
jgi:Flp pilus assembly protein TadG